MGSGKVSPSGGGGASPSGPPHQAPASECCMCGDRGLLPELFRCSACSVRSQHTYCTDRYPKAESYGTCNWCLRAEEGAASTTTSHDSPRSSAGKGTGRPAAHGDTTGARSLKVAARGDFASSNLSSKPIKKQQQQQRLVLRRSASDLGNRVRADHNAPPSPGVARGRPRVRRYKLLEEVITS